MNLKHRYLTVNGVNLHLVEAGDPDGPLIILLHGFPEFWYGWRQQIPFLAEQDFCVWAPDQRGYNLSDKPEGAAAYSLDVLAADIAGLIRVSGRKQAILVGHDWGAAAAWWTAVCYPQMIARLNILNVPHPAVMSRTLRKNWQQLGKSWYIFYFQLPILPELMLRAGNGRALAAALQRSGRPGAFSEADLREYREAWSRPRVMSGMLNWYRAALRHRPARRDSIRVTAPTQIIWGAQDAFLETEMAAASLELCDNGRLTLIPQATHWVQHEEAAQVNQLLLEFALETNA